jgi:hypothetical protein
VEWAVFGRDECSSCRLKACQRATLGVYRVVWQVVKHIKRVRRRFDRRQHYIFHSSASMWCACTQSPCAPMPQLMSATSLPSRRASCPHPLGFGTEL